MFDKNQEANCDSEIIPSRSKSFLVCLIALAFCFSTSPGCQIISGTGSIREIQKKWHGTIYAYYNRHGMFQKTVSKTFMCRKSAGALYKKQESIGVHVRYQGRTRMIHKTLDDQTEPLLTPEAVYGKHEKICDVCDHIFL